LPSFTAHVDVVTGRLTVSGRLDGRSAHRLHDAVSVLLRAEHPTLTVDAAGLDVADHAGLRAIVGVYRRALRHGRRITVHGASPSLQHALTRLRLNGHVLPGVGESSRGDPYPVDDRPGNAAS
jgi:anti-anti-sigma factor